MAWAAFKHDIDVYFFWHGVHWQHNRQKQGERQQNVWANPITFDNRGQPNKTDHGYLNGDGVLFYPGEEKVHPEEDRGIAGPGGHRAAREPAPRPAGPPVPDAGPRSAGRRAVVDEALRAVVPQRVLGRGRDGGLRGDGRRVRGGAAGAGRGDRGRGNGARAMRRAAPAALLAAASLAVAPRRARGARPRGRAC